jgi:hypothetical protein
VITALALGAGTGLGVWLVVRGLFPPRPSLADALAHLRRVPEVPPVLAPTSEGGVAARVGRPVAEWLGHRGAGWLVPGRIRHDLAILDRSPERHLAEKVTLCLVGFLLVPTFAALLTLGGAHLSLAQRSRASWVYGPGIGRSWNSCTEPFMRRKSRRCRSLATSSSLRRSSSGSIHSFSSSFWIMAAIDLSFSTSVQTQQPKRLSPQLGVLASTTSGHSPSGEAPWYIVSRSLLEYPHGLVACMRNSQTSSLVQSSMGENTRQFGSAVFGLSWSLTRWCSRSVIRLARPALSALRVPSTRIASPWARTTLRMKAFDGLILSRSVHQRNLGRGAG